MPVHRLFVHSVQAAQELSRARAVPVKALLGEAITGEAIKALGPLDVRPEPTARVHKKGRARFNEPMLPAEIAISQKMQQAVRAAAKRLGCSSAQIYRTLVDRYLGAALHASSH